MKKRILLFILLISSFSYAQNNYEIANNYFADGAYEKATILFKKLYDRSPYNTTYLEKLIACYQETNQFSTAETLLKARIKQNPSQGYLYVLLGHNYERQEQKEEAASYYEKALLSIEKNPNYGGLIASVFKNYTLLDEAVLAYEKTVEHNPNANYSFQIAQIYGEQGNYEKMFPSYISLIDINPNYLQTVQRYLSRYLTNDGENEGNVLFKKTLLRKAASNPKDVWNILLSWLFALQKDYHKALIQEKALYQRTPENLSKIFGLGKIAFENNDFKTAEESFDFVNQNTNISEEKIEALLFLAKIAVETKNPKAENQFLSIFKQFGENHSTIKVQVSYAAFLSFHKNDPTKAIEVLENALRFSVSKFDKARIKIKLGEVLVFTGRPNKALLYFSQIQAQLKNHPLAQEARFKVAQTSYFKGDFTWAKAQLKVLKGATTQLIANDALALFLIISDNEPVDSIPSGLLQYAKADLLSFQNKDTEAIETLNEIIHDFKGHPIEDEALFKQAQLMIKKNDLTNAIANFEKVIALNPDGILIDNANYELAELYNYQLNNPEKASEYYQKIIFDFPSSIYLVAARKKFRKLRGDTPE